MKIPSKEFIDKFKSVRGALSVTESIAIINIASQAPPNGLWLELGVHMGKSAMSAVYGGTSKEFHLVDTEFEKTLPTGEIAANIGAVTKSKTNLVFIVEESVKFLENSNFGYSYVFSDAGIHDDEVTKEVKLLEDRIISGGIICFHDCGNQFTAVQRAYDYLLTTGKFDVIPIDWAAIINHVRENKYEQGNDSWHLYDENPFPNYVGALRRR